MLQQHFVDFTRGDVFSALDDQLLDPTGNENKTVLVHMTKIAGAEPSIRGD